MNANQYRRRIGSAPFAENATCDLKTATDIGPTYSMINDTFTKNGDATPAPSWSKLIFPSPAGNT
jgi:hypothetical protein